MSTRSVTFNQQELSLISQWATRAFQEVAAYEIRQLPDSPKQKAALADMDTITTIKDKLRP